MNADSSSADAIGVVGVGWVGLVTAACFASLGHRVWAMDVDERKIERLRAGEVAFHEPGLAELVADHRERLSFTTSMDELLANARLLFCCVDTPPTYSGDADLSRVRAVVSQLPEGDDSHVLVMKSTVPSGTGASIRRDRPGLPYVSCPEFLKEGSAVKDFLNPDRVVIGADPGDEHAAAAVKALYEPLGGELVLTDVASAEMIKLASNAFLATKISFINEIANVCEEVGADVTEVARGMGLDGRIGPAFLNAGVGYGGSCFLGEETVLVRRGKQVGLWRLDELFGHVAIEEDAPMDAECVFPADLEVLALDREGPVFRPVQALTSRPYEGEIVEVRTKMGRRVTTTVDHPFLVMSPEEGERDAEVKEAGELTTEDWLPLAVGSNGVDLEERTLGFRAASVIGAPGGIAFEDVIVRSSTSAMEGFGRMTVDERAPALADHPRGLAQRSGDIRRSGAISKRIPDVAWTLPVDQRRRLLADIWTEGGRWSFVEGTDSVVLEYGTVSRELADGLLRLLQMENLVASVRVGRVRKSTVDTYWLRLSGADQVERGDFLVDEADREEIAASLSRLTKRIKSTGYRHKGTGVVGVRVTGLQRRHHSGRVYSLEIPAPHAVVTTAGLVVHQCFPKDVSALKQLAGNSGYHFQLLNSVIEVNELQKRRVIGKLTKHLGSLVGKRIALLGLAFKPNTDDMREASSLVLSARLQGEGAAVVAYDPVASGPASALLPTVEMAESAEVALRDADGAILVTEWPQFAELDWAAIAGAMRTPLIVDGRNFLDPAALTAAGVTYEGIGRNGLGAS